MEYSTGHEMRGLFASMTINGFPTVRIFYDNDLMRHMMKDYLDQRHMSLNVAYNHLLDDLSKLFGYEDKQLSDYGLPMPAFSRTELESAESLYESDDQASLFQQLNEAEPNNTEQQHVFDVVSAAIREWTPDSPLRIFFLQGTAGTGKTSITKKLLAFVRSLGLIAVCMAATTLACKNFDDAVTAHSFWKYPVVDEDDRDPENMPECKLYNTQRKELIDNTTFFAWDEMPSNHREIFESAFKWIKTGVMLLIGDFRQTLPVIEGGDKSDILAACIASSPHWYKFSVLHLTINMRLLATGDADQISHAESILALGEGREGSDIETLWEDRNLDTSIVGFYHVDYFLDNQHEEAIAWLYPRGFHFATIEELSNTAILCATNERVDWWNGIIHELNENEGVELLSTDIFNDIDDRRGHLRKLLTSSLLDTVNAKGVPPHRLLLKIGDICLVTRCLKANDLATNSRVKIVHISDHVIRAQTIGPASKRVLIPRIRFKLKIKQGDNFSVMRTQFPLRLAYSVTYNKCQGMTLHKVLVDTVHAPFAHGHTFVATSRVRNKHNMRFFCTQESIHDNPSTFGTMPIVTNIVYKDLLTKIGIIS